MKIIRNSIIPFKGFRAINLFGVLFVRKDAEITEEVLRHEQIHTAQMREMLYVGFYVWYVVVWLLRYAFTDETVHEAYRNISFEREAYSNQANINYLKQRSFWAWLDY